MHNNDKSRSQPSWYKPPVVEDATEEEIAQAMERSKHARSLVLNLADENWSDMGPKDRLTHASKVLADLASSEQPDAIVQLMKLLPADVLQKLASAAGHHLSEVNY